VARSTPPIRAWPRSGASTVDRILRHVDLPAPFGPSRPVILASAAAKLTPSSARTAPNCLPSASTSITAGSPLRRARARSRSRSEQRQEERHRRLERETRSVERLLRMLEERAEEARYAADRDLPVP